jgi:hypothetical protein
MNCIDKSPLLEVSEEIDGVNVALSLVQANPTSVAVHVTETGGVGAVVSLSLASLLQGDERLNYSDSCVSFLLGSDETEPLAVPMLDALALVLPAHVVHVTLSLATKRRGGLASRPLLNFVTSQVRGVFAPAATTGDVTQGSA